MKGLTRTLISFILAFSTTSPLRGGLFLNEISAGGSADWIELKLSPDTASMDISPLFVTMYYGSNEALAVTPVTLYGEDKPETPWDDRFAVIYFSESISADETDAAGDLNNNRIRDIYCANYGLWTTDCCVSIDTDDIPSNNGIIDFMAFSNRDGEINKTIASYINYAIEYGAWNDCASVNLQDCCCDIGSEKLQTWSTLSRTGSVDAGSMDDFIITPYATPGKENITDVSAGKGKLIKLLKNRIVHNYGCTDGNIELPLFLYRSTSLRVRIFNSAGLNIYTGPLVTDAVPGYFTAVISERNLKGKVLTGLYPVSLEAVDSESGRAESFRMILIIVRDR